jgi:hypothetical protein
LSDLLPNWNVVRKPAPTQLPTPGVRDPAETGDAAEFRMEIFATQQPMFGKADLGAAADNPTSASLLNELFETDG